MRITVFRVLLFCCLLMSAATTVVSAAEISPQRLLLLRGVIALGEDRRGAALADLEQAAALAPEDWRSQMLYGQALAHAGHPEMARSMLRRATLLAPSRPEPWQALAQFAGEQQDATLEHETLKGLQRVLPDDPLLLHHLSEVYRKMGNATQAAQTTLQWEAGLPPLQLEYHYTYQDHTATLEELRQLAQQQPSNTEVLGALAAQEWKAEHGDAARAVLKQLYELQPRNLTYICNYVYVCLETGQYEEGLRVLQAAVPLQYQTFDRLPAIWCVTLQHYSEAIPLLQHSLAGDPEDEALNRRLAIAFIGAGDYRQAEPPLQKLWQKSHSGPLAQVYAAVLHANGHDDLAESILNDAIKQYPAKSILKVELSRLYRDTNRMTHSADLTMEVAKERPEAVELLILAGERYIRAGYVQRAFSAACTLRDDYPMDVSAARGAMTLFHQLGDLADARLVLTRFLGPSVTTPLSPAEVLYEVGMAAPTTTGLPKRASRCKPCSKVIIPSVRPMKGWGSCYCSKAAGWEAARLYAQALEQWPNDPHFTLALARAYRQAGNYTQALASYRQATRLMSSATPWLECAEIYHDLGQETQARDCWLHAGTLPDGAVNGRLSLLASYEEEGARGQALTLADELLDKLAIERKARSKHWSELFAAYNLTVSEDEMTALLQLDLELTDPAPVQMRRDLLAARHAAVPAPEDPHLRRCWTRPRHRHRRLPRRRPSRRPPRAPPPRPLPRRNPPSPIPPCQHPRQQRKVWESEE